MVARSSISLYIMQRWTWRVVKTNKRESSVEVALPTAETDIKAAYEDAIRVLSTKPPKEEKTVDAETAQEPLSLQLPGKVRNVFLILALADNHFLLYSVLMAWVLSNVSC